ncbi:MAG TPA: hypothetical protein VD994_18015 [Prosthecobacter sp.]|nr:hypothetical protein [Prosthecobacter sp.]
MPFRTDNIESALERWIATTQRVVAERIEREVAPVIREKVEAIIKEEAVKCAFEVRKFVRADEASERIMICIGDVREG